MIKNFYIMTSPKRLAQIIIILISIFVATSLQRFSIHPSGAHTYRQSDTIGMSMMFAQELQTRGIAALDFIIYPQVLQKGLSDGINASEFPLLNVITGPFYLFGSPWMGVFLSSLFILLLNLYTSYHYLPRLLRFWKVEIDGKMGMLLWFAAPTLAQQTNTIMPEGLAFPLMIIGICLILRAPQKWNQSLLGILFCNLGVAVKPTLIITLAGVIALLIIKENRKYSLRYVMATLMSIVLPAYWYTVHAKNILSFAQGPQIFALAHFDPLTQLKEVGLTGVLGLMKDQLNQGGLPMFVGWIWVVVALLSREWIPLLLYLLALIAAICLDGTHIAVHSYYFIGTCLFSLLLMTRVLARTQKHLALHRFLFILLIWGVIYNIRLNVWTWARDSHYWHVDFWKMGEKANALIPHSYHLVSDDGPYPQRMLFIGRSGTIGRDHPWAICDHPNYSQLPLAIVSENKPLPATFCEGRTLEIRSIRTSFAKWLVVLASPKNDVYKNERRTQ